MEDVALSSAGARVSLATSSDERYPAESVTDGSSSTFWMSTGTFPQEFIITLADVTSIQSMRIECYNVRKLAVEHSMSSEPINFEPLSEIELEHNESNLQTEDINANEGMATTGITRDVGSTAARAQVAALGALPFLGSAWDPCNDSNSSSRSAEAHNDANHHHRAKEPRPTAVA
ncbi:unnamed protein product [Lampetra planeri]